MYAISHAAAALALKRRYPPAGLWTLLVAVQAVELLWVTFTYLGLEHIEASRDAIHLGFLPYSHSIATGVGLSVLAWAVLRYGPATGGDADGAARRRLVATAVALAIVSHVVLDLLQHEPDITLLPWAWGPRLGLGLSHWPLANLLVELAFGVACWWVFRGGVGLLVAIVILNLLDAPFMFPRPGAGAAVGAHPAVLTTIILVQIVVSWLAVAWLAGPRRAPESLGAAPIA